MKTDPATGKEARDDEHPELASVTINGRTETFRRGTFGYEMVMLITRKHPEPKVTEYRNVLSSGEVVITRHRSRLTVAERRAAGPWVPVGEGEQG